jgi:hypothetical protein
MSGDGLFCGANLTDCNQEYNRDECDGYEGFDGSD